MRVFLILLLVFPLLLAADISQTYTVQPPQLRGAGFANDLPRLMDAGLPALPYVPVRLLVPAGERCTEVTVTLANESIVPGVTIEHNQEQVPTSQSASVYTAPDMSVYGVDALWPVSTFNNLGTQRKQGYDILLLNVFPYRWNPVSRQLVWSDAFTVNVSTSASRATQDDQGRKIRTDIRARQRIADFVDNPEMVYSYSSLQAQGGSRDPEGPYSLIIITDSQREPYFADYITWQQDHGMSTGIFTTNWIYSEYNGNDNADAVRNFIIDAYESYAASGTPLEYVILGGDDEIVPERGCRGQVGGTIDYRMPSDIYYSCLDGTWNADGDDIYGESSDNVDMMPEVAIGRMSAEAQSEFNNIFNKIYHYTDDSTYSNDIAYMFGENLNDNPVTWGGDYKDRISPYLPEGFHLNTLYQRDGTYSSVAVQSAINNGLAIINHMGHANQSTVFGLTSANTAAFTNTEFGFAYSQGCYAAAFDERTSQAGECIAENLVNCDGGLYTFVGNSRYGWYAPGSTDGASEFFDITFFEGLFDENVRRLGDANNYSKEQLVNEALQNDVMRWVYYEVMIVGDPTVWVKDPSGDYPYIVTGNVTYDDTQGDGDGTINPGETVNIFIQLQNLQDWAAAPIVNATISCEDPAIEIVTATAEYGAIAPGDTSVNLIPYVIVVPQDCNYASYAYTITVTAQSAGGVFQRSYTMSFDIGLYQTGWPWTAGQQFRGAPIVYDYDGNGIDDLVTVNVTGGVSVLDFSGGLVEGYPVEHDENLWRSTAFADMNNDGSPDVIYASRTGQLGAWNLDGSDLFVLTDCGDLLITPIVADINGDGDLEVMSIGLNNMVIAIDNQGRMMDGYPVEVGTSASDLAAADLDNDGAAEVLVGTLSGQLYAIRGDGSILNGFPVDLGSGVCAGPTILGNQRIAVGTMDNSLQLISPDGELLWSRMLPGRIAGSVITADIAPGGWYEIALTTQNGYVMLIDQGGADLEGWPVDLDATIINPPLAADIDNDDTVELAVFTGLSNLYVFHYDATEVDFSPVPVNLVGNTPGSIADMDGDGDAEIICGVSSGAVIIDCKLPMGQDAPWVTYRGNLCRTGNYLDTNVDVQGEEDMKARTELGGNWPNPFNPVTNVSFSLAAAGQARVDVYNVRGQRVRTLVNESLTAGSHTVQWNGTDDTGRNVSSGVYFCRLSAGGKEDVRKMLLLK